MNKENCVLKLVDEIILYYDARSKKHQIVYSLFHTRSVDLMLHDNGPTGIRTFSSFQCFDVIFLCKYIDCVHLLVNYYKLVIINAQKA